MSGLVETSAEADARNKPVFKSIRKPVSVTIIVRNEAKRVGACIDSTSRAHEFLVGDVGSADATREICREHGALFIQNPWQGCASQNFVSSKANHSWMLSQDAKECVSPELAKEILFVLSADGPCDGHCVSRENIFLDSWSRHGDLWPDCERRLFRRDARLFNEKSVCKSVVAKG